MEVKTIEGRHRPNTGKGVARRLRAEHLVPAICYGSGREPTPLSLDPHALVHALDPDRGWNTVLKLKILKDDSAEEALILVKDFQRHPIRRNYLHFDLVAVSEDEPVTVEVPIELTGKSIGVKDGGILQQVHRSLEIKALPFAIPAHLTVDVTNLHIGEAIHIRDMVFPEGVTPLLDARITVCNVVAPHEDKAASEGEGEIGAGAVAEASPAAAEKK